MQMTETACWRSCLCKMIYSVRAWLLWMWPVTLPILITVTLGN